MRSNAFEKHLFLNRVVSKKLWRIMQFQRIIMVMESLSNTWVPPLLSPLFKKFRIMKYVTSALFCTKNEPHSSLRTIYMSFQKEIRSAKNQWFFTLRDVIFWVMLRPLLKKCTFFSFKNHISVSNCRIKLIFDCGEFWDCMLGFFF